MSSKEVWGSDPEQVLKAQPMFVHLAAYMPDEAEAAADGAAETVAMPSGRDSQVSELGRMFVFMTLRSYRRGPICLNG